jgi:hypothetical protein
MKIHVALAASAAALLTTTATVASAADKPAPRECFWTRQADGFAAQDDHTVNVRVSVRDVYQFKLLGSCPDIDWNQRIALVSHGSNICSGMDAEIVTHSPIGPQRCAVSDMRKLTPEEIAALPRKARP